MEVIAGVASAITIVQVTEEIGNLCGSYIRGVRHAQKDIERLQSKVSALNEVMTRLNHASLPNINPTTVQKCCDDVCSIRERLKPKETQATRKRWALRARALKWPFTSKEVEEQVKAMEQYLSLFSLTLSQNIHEKAVDAEQEQLLEKLAYAGDAPFNSYENDHRHRPCLENTRVDVLQQIMDWTTNIPEQCIFWLRGLAGTGKSTIATTVGYQLKAKPCHIASYFFKRGHSDLAEVRKLIPTIVRQLSERPSSYRRLVSEAVKKEPGLGQSANLREQYEKLLVEPLRKIRPSQEPFFIIMDALDECDEPRDLRMLLRLLARTEDIPQLGLKIFVTSRPELPIRNGFKEIPRIFHCYLALQNVPRSVVDGDIRAFLRHELNEIQHEFHLPADWPAYEDLDTLARKAGGLFIFAATAVRYIRGSPLALPEERLKDVCNTVATNTLMTEELDEMYTIVLKKSVPGKYTAKEEEIARVRFRHIVGSIVLLLDPLSIAQLFSLVSGSHVKSQKELEVVLQALNAVIDVPEDGARGSIQPLHLSFRDFLLDPKRCPDRRFLVDEQQAHQDLALSCVRLLSGSLSRELCQLPSLGTLRSEIDPTIVGDILSQAVEYACRHLVDHAQRGSMVVDDHGCIHAFLQKHFLHWVWCMSLLGRISQAIASMTNLTAMTDFQRAPLAHEFVNDCRRFVMAFRPVIEEAPGQVYASALLYSPLQSSVRRNFKDIVPQGIKLKPQPPERWSPCLQTLSCNYLPLMVAFSRDGKLLTTSGWAFSSSNPSRYQCLDIWDPQTGECQSYLKAYVKEPVIEKLSPNGHMVVSVSSDGILRLWDMAESEDRFILENHPSPITAAEFSFDSQSLALGSQDGTIRLLDTTTGECRCSFEGHSESIRFLVFSPDCTIIATGAADETVHIWNLQTGSHHLAIACQAFSLWPEGDLYVYGDDPYVYGEVVFSPDSRFLAAGSANKAVRVWDVVNGKCRFNLEGHSRKLCMVIFSPTGQLLASGSLDHTVRLWDMQTGDCRSIFEGFQVGMAFSPDGQFLAFGSRGYLVRLWSVQDEEYRSVLDGHTSSVNTICFSPDGQFLVSGSWDLTVRIWDMHLGQYPPNVEPIMDDHLRRVIFSPNGEIVASESRKNKIRLWNPETGESCLDYEGKGASFSSDGQLMISTSEDEVRLLELRTKTHRFLSKGDSRFAVLSPDGQLAAVASSDNSVQLWNTQNNNETFTFEGHPGEIQQLVFSPTGDLIASGAKYDDVRIWDTKTGEHIANFRNSFGLFDMTFAPNGELLASGSWLWDVPAGCLRFDLEGGNEEIHAFVFSPNSQLVAGPSWDSKVHLWDTRTGEHLLTVPYQSMNPRIEFLTGIDAVFVDGTAYEIGSAKMTKVEIAHHSRLLSDLLIDSSGEWVTRSSKRVLWLPPERRPYDYAVWRNKIAIGSNDGRMTFLTFEEEPSRQSGDGQGREERMALRLRN